MVCCYFSTPQNSDLVPICVCAVENVSENQLLKLIASLVNRLVLLVVL